MTSSARSHESVSSGHAPGEAVAAAASLKYVTDSGPGIRRIKAGAGFRYVKPDGTRVTEKATLARIDQIVIPPAWTDVWIAPAANGHVQATGRDARGRKQHRYHARWRAVRDQDKFGRLARFGRALPRIRRRVTVDLAARGMPRQRILAMVVRLLETTYIRIGNEEYARTNGSYGLTTMHDDHVSIRGARIRFMFRGKSGKEHDIELHDQRLAKLVRRSRDLPGEVLFQYIDDDGDPHPLSSTDVNAYLHEVAGDEFTAKDFRTWAGTLLAARTMEAESHTAQGDALTKAAVVRAVKATAATLGNTAAVCRKCYVHPDVLDVFQNDAHLAGWRALRAKHKTIAGLSRDEAALVHFLEGRENKTAGKNLHRAKP